MNEWRAWFKRQQEKQAKGEGSGSQLPAPKRGKEPVPTRPMTEEEAAKVKRLQRVSTAWGSMDRRFIQQFEGATPETMITERQAWYIDVLLYKYRRQTGYKGPKPAGYQGRG